MSASPATRPPTILLVDDDAQVRSLTRTFLEYQGYTVLACSDAILAAEVALSATPIDLLITDLHMPPVSGMDLALQLQHLRPATPVLLVSGDLLSQDRLADVQRQGWSFLDKPFAFPKLLASIHGILHPANTA